LFKKVNNNWKDFNNIVTESKSILRGIARWSAISADHVTRNDQYDRYADQCYSRGDDAGQYYSRGDNVG